MARIKTKNVVEAFSAMALDQQPDQHLQHPPRGFPGGSHAPQQCLLGGHRVYAAAPNTGPGDLPSPPAMPQPHSLPQTPGQDQRRSPGISRTMQHAPGSPPHQRLSKPISSITAHLRFDAKQALRSPLPDDEKHQRSDINIKIAIEITQSAGWSSLPVTPERPTRARASPSPRSTSSSPSGTVVQCNGVTKAGKQCRRKIKVTSSSPDNHDKHFCHQHSKEILSPIRIRSHKNRGEWIQVAKWVPSYLHPDTQIALRDEMNKALSSSDGPGFIYTLEILDPDSPSIVKFKVGRTVNLVKRIDEWSKLCGSEQYLRGVYPGVGKEGDSNGENLMKGRVRPGQKTSYCHRLERLIHLELEDLVAHRIYLDPDWHPGWPASVSVTAPDKGPRKVLKREKCSYCPQTHREIFEFSRIRSGIYKNQEFERIVKPVIERWGKFVEAHYGDADLDLVL